MDNEEIAVKAYLQAVYDSTQGDPEVQVSMHEVGIPLGYDKAESGRMAEELMVGGFIELRTLAGGISITPTGLDHLGFSSPATAAGATARLSGETTVNDSDRAIFVEICRAIKNEIAKEQIDYTALEQAVLDLKAIELHLLSPTPKTAVVIELLRSLDTALSENGTFREKSGIGAIL